jgi:hypothetical protein
MLAGLLVEEEVRQIRTFEEARQIRTFVIAYARASERKKKKCGWLR